MSANSVHIANALIRDAADTVISGTLYLFSGSNYLITYDFSQHTRFIWICKNVIAISVTNSRRTKKNTFNLLPTNRCLSRLQRLLRANFVIEQSSIAKKANILTKTFQSLFSAGNHFRPLSFCMTLAIATPEKNNSTIYLLSNELINRLRLWFFFPARR